MTALVVAGDSRGRTITADEVREWFGRKGPNEEQCEELADRLTKMRWPSDPPPALLPLDAVEWYWRARIWQPTDPPLRKPDSIGNREVWDFAEPTDGRRISGTIYAVQADGSCFRQDVVFSEPDQIKTDKWWDLQGAVAAANKLRESIPRMLKYWDDVRNVRERCEGVPTMSERYDAVKKLDDALSSAMPCFHPFRELSDKAKRSRRPQLKKWHIPSILIADFVTKAMVTSGHAPPSLERDSVAVRVVCKSLVRMSYGNFAHGAISEHLKRWTKQYGRRTEKTNS